MDDARVVVAGAGPAGLVAARHLADTGATVTVFEREDEVGGRVRSRRRDGYVFDRGFQVLFDSYPAARRELRYEDLDLRAFSPGAVIADGDRRSVLADPFRDPGALTESLFNRQVTVGDKLRTLRLRFELKGRSFEDTRADRDRSIREYLRDRGFSRKFVENFAAPFYGGITLDRSLSTSARVFEYTFGRLATGDTVVPAFGMGAIAEDLRSRAERAGATVETGVAVDAVDAEAGDAAEDGGGDDRPAPDAGVTVSLPGETVAADAAVVATGPRPARELTGVEAIPTGGVGSVTQYYALDSPLPVGRRILLNAVDASPNAVVPLSAVSPEYAPDGTHLISATFLDGADGGADVPPDPFAADGAELAARTFERLEEWFPERRFDGFERLHTDRIPFSQFEQPPGVYDGLPGVRAPAGPVYLAGEFTRWSSIQGAMESGRDAARAVAADLDLGPGPG